MKQFEVSQVRETNGSYVNGILMALVELAVVAAVVYSIYQSATLESVAWGLGSGALFLLAALLLLGFFVVAPNTGRALVLLGGRYVGTVRKDGFWWANPFTVKKHVSLRVRNFNSEKLKVNDATGNPIEIAAVIVWRVTDTAKALFDVESYTSFVAVQSETAIRALASRYPYDEHEAVGPSLRGSPDEVADALRAEVDARLVVSGVEVIETRISHLAYAPEIAQAMLRRQQAAAVIAARQMIVDGAVGMVEIALRRLKENNVVDLDTERTAAMVNNLMVALVSESNAQPVINTGTLYT